MNVKFTALPGRERYFFATGVALGINLEFQATGANAPQGFRDVRVKEAQR